MLEDHWLNGRSHPHTNSCLDAFKAENIFGIIQYNFKRVGKFENTLSKTFSTR